MSTPCIKAVLFDLDDTLWPIAPVITRAEVALHDWLTHHAPRVAGSYTIEHLRERRAALMAANEHFRINLTALRREVLLQVFAETGEDVSRIDDAMEAFMEARNAVTLYDDVLPALPRLAGLLPLGTISNGNSDLRRIGLAHHFQVSLSAPSFGRAKPDPAIFIAACDALQVAPQHAVYVGDDPDIDVLGAQRAGLQSVWINRAGRELPTDIAPDGICCNLHELHDWLQDRIGN